MSITDRTTPAAGDGDRPLDEVTQAELDLVLAADVRCGECLYCYLCRVLTLVGCPGDLRFTRRWCDAQREDTRRVLPWVRRRRGSCDCEVVVNVFGDGMADERLLRLRCRPSVRGGRCP